MTSEVSRFIQVEVGLKQDKPSKRVLEAIELTREMKRGQLAISNRGHIEGDQHLGKRARLGWGRERHLVLMELGSNALRTSDVRGLLEQLPYDYSNRYKATKRIKPRDIAANVYVVTATREDGDFAHPIIEKKAAKMNFVFRLKMRRTIKDAVRAYYK